MPVYRPTPRPQLRGAATMLPYKPPAAVTPAQPTPTPTPTPTPQSANLPGNVSLAQAPGGALTVTWTTPAIDSTHDAATGFNLQYTPVGISTWTAISGVTSPYLLSGLPAGVAIDVRLQSTNAGGASAWSATSMLSTVPGAPNAPSVSLAQGTGSNFTVTWNAPPIDSTHNAATGFNLRSSPSGANIWTTATGVTSPYTLSGLAAGAAIDVQVESLNSAGLSAWSATSTLTTMTAAPNAPGGVSLAQGTGSNLTVSWTAPATDSTHNAATGYNLRSSPSGASTWTTVTGVTSPYTLSGLASSVAIDVQVENTNAAGASAWSATSTLTTAVTAGPYAPNSPTITSVAPPADGTTSKLSITWTAPAVDGTHGAATGYNLRTSPSGAGTWTTVTNVSSPYTLTGLAGATAIDVEVQATNASAASPGPWSGITTGSTYASTITLANPPVATSIAHNSGTAPTVVSQAIVSGSPTTIQAQWATSGTIAPTTWQANGGAFLTYQATWYLALTAATNTPGSAYIWVQALNSSSQVIGELVVGPYTIT
jgi:hypothetical protein